MCNKSESIQQLAVALVKFNGEVSRISKDAANPFFKSNYATLDNIIDEVRPILTKHGLSILQLPGGDGENVVMKTMILHESGEWIESDPLIMRPVKNDPQSMGSCVTYARRYSLAAILSLNTGEDDDGNKATHTTSPQGREPQRQGNPPTTQQRSQQSQSSASSCVLASEGQTKMLFAKHKASGMADLAPISDFLGYTVTKFADVQAEDVTKLAQWLDKQKAS